MYDIPTEEQLEAYIDKHGLLHLLVAIENICHEKAEHLRANWQDNQSAKVWERDAATVIKAARSINN